MNRGPVLVRNDRSGQSLPSMELNKGTVSDVALGLSTGRFIVPSVEAGSLFVLGVGRAGLVRSNGDRGAPPTSGSPSSYVSWSCAG